MSSQLILSKVKETSDCFIFTKKRSRIMRTCKKEEQSAGKVGERKRGRERKK